MKRITANAISLMVVFLLFTAVGFAQQHLTIKADVPFEFSVGRKTFPAGEYWVAQVAPQTLALRDSHNGFLTFVMTDPMISLTEGFTPKLKFAVEDGRPVLSEVWGEGTTGYKLFVPKPTLAGTEVEATTIEK